MAEALVPQFGTEAAGDSPPATGMILPRHFNPQRLISADQLLRLPDIDTLPRLSSTFADVEASIGIEIGRRLPPELITALGLRDVSWSMIQAPNSLSYVFIGVPPGSGGEVGVQDAIASVEIGRAVRTDEIYGRRIIVESVGVVGLAQGSNTTDVVAAAVRYHGDTGQVLAVSMSGEDVGPMLMPHAGIITQAMMQRSGHSAILTIGSPTPDRLNAASGRISLPATTFDALRPFDPKDEAAERLLQEFLQEGKSPHEYLTWIMMQEGSTHHDLSDHTNNSPPARVLLRPGRTDVTFLTRHKGYLPFPSSALRVASAFAQEFSGSTTIRDVGGRVYDSSLYLLGVPSFNFPLNPKDVSAVVFLLASEQLKSLRAQLARPRSDLYVK